MDATRYTIGVDFGTESARAVLVDVADGRELGVEVYAYRNGVIDVSLPAPDDDVLLGPDWALQDPEDYLETFRTAVRAWSTGPRIDPAQVIGIGIDFTACTMLPTTADGTPLCRLDAVPARPARVGQALEAPRRPARGRRHQSGRRANSANRGSSATAARSRPSGSSRRRSRSCARRPATYRAADRLLEAADWVVWQLTGGGAAEQLHRRLQGDLVGGRRLPGARVLRGARTRFRVGRRRQDVARHRPDRGIGRRADARRRPAGPGLRPGTTVAVANVDAHVSVPAATVTRPGTLVAIMGTSICHILLADDDPSIAGMCGVVADGVIPGTFGFEAGQAAVGDIFAWFAENAVPPSFHETAPQPGRERPRRPRRRGGRPPPRRIRAPRTRLVERQPVGAGRCGPVGRPVRGDPRDDRGRDLPRPHRGDGVRHAGHHRCLRGRRLAIDEVVGCGGLPGPQPAPDADLRGRHRADLADRGVVAGAGAGLGDVRRGRGRTRGRRLRHDRGRGAGDGPSPGGALRADRAEQARLRPPVRANTSGSTTCSDGAGTLPSRPSSSSASRRSRQRA